MGKHSAKRGQRRSRTGPDPSKAAIRLEPATSSAESAREYGRRRSRRSVLESERIAHKRKKVLLGCGVALLVAIVGIVAYGGVWVGALDRRMSGDIRSDEGITSALKAAGTSTREPFYVLVMGVDAREEGEASRSDTLIVARVDPRHKRMVLLSIPRDTRVEVPEHGTTKINAAHAYGGPELAIRTVSKFTGLPISHYVEIDFNGFKQVVDALGGVTVEVPEDIYDMKAAGHDPSAARLKAGVQRLDGAHALTFVRSRQFPEGDLQRIRNQQTFFKAVLTEMQKPENLLRLPSTVEAFAAATRTDMTVSQMLQIAADMKGMDPGDLETVTMPGTPQSIGGVSYVIADEPAFEQMLARIESGERVELSGDEQVANRLDPSSVTVSVRNGAGIEGVAKSAAAVLAQEGFVIAEVGNANQFVYDETLVVYDDHVAAAEAVASRLGRGRVVESKGMYSFSTDVLVVVGKDWNR